MIIEVTDAYFQSVDSDCLFVCVCVCVCVTVSFCM